MDCVHHGYSGDGYASQRRNGVRRYCHHWAFIDRHGAIPAGRVVDHICRNRWCVNPDHLRAATLAENARNASPRGGSSRYKGVSLHRATGLWQAHIKVEGAGRWLGNFVTEREAADAYDAAAVGAWGGHAYLNRAVA